MLYQVIANIKKKKRVNKNQTMTAFMELTYQL